MLATDDKPAAMSEAAPRKRNPNQRSGDEADYRRHEKAVGSGKRLTLSAGEERLSQWMDENARVDKPRSERHPCFLFGAFRVATGCTVKARALPILPR
jgi:hypothetical protein